MLKHFKIYEFVDKETYELLGEQAWKLFNMDLLLDLDWLRFKLDKKITVNDWYWGGEYQNRGFRTAKSTVGSTTSQHRSGNAVDFTVDGMTAEEVRQFILDNEDTYEDINRMEDDVSWVHIDGKHVVERIHLFKP